MTLYKCPNCCKGDLVTEGHGACEMRSKHECPECKEEIVVEESFDAENELHIVTFTFPSYSLEEYEDEW